LTQVAQLSQVSQVAPIISIDPKGCIDIDDAFSIEYLDNKINRVIFQKALSKFLKK
jgi:hypothetical protein